MIQIDIVRKEADYGFVGTDAAGHTVKMDTSPDGGGSNFGIRPMQMMLMGMGGCAGIDIVSILKKQRQTVDSFSMKVEGEREKGKEPSLWETVHIVFELKGNIDPEKAKRACELSMDKYCSVAETMRRAGTVISWELKVL